MPAFLTKNRNGNNIAYNYTNSDNKIESATVNGSNYSFAYDTKGNITNDGLNNALLGNYSFRNLPTTMNNFNYTYNDNGERIKKLETDSARTDYYLRDYLGRELVIYNYETNDAKEVNIFGNELVGKIELTDSTVDRYYYLKDHLGSVRSVVDNNGGVVSAQDYYPYGETIRQFNNTRYMLTEKERDTESSNDYFGARYYNSKLGVWLQVDPLSGKLPSLSPYNYTLSNPLNFFDRDGKIPWPILSRFLNYSRRHENNFGEQRPRGRSHKGVDFNYLNAGNRDYGAPIFSTHDGVVIKIGSIKKDKNGAGNRIVMRSKKGTVTTAYYHLMSAPGFKVGDIIREGQYIGNMGRSGFGTENAYNSHLHYELWLNGAPMNFIGEDGEPIDPQELLLEEEVFNRSVNSDTNNNDNSQNQNNNLNDFQGRWEQIYSPSNR